VVGLGFDRGDVAQRSEQAAVVEPVDPLEHRVLDRVGGAPGADALDEDVLGSPPPPAESWFGGFKNKLIQPIGAFATRNQVVLEIARYVRCYSTTRRNSALQTLAPATLERAHTLTRAA